MVAMDFKRTTHAVQRCKNEQQRCSHGRDGVDARRGRDGVDARRYMDKRRIQRDIEELNRGPIGHLCAFCRIVLPCYKSRKEEETGRMIT